MIIYCCNTVSCITEDAVRISLEKSRDTIFIVPEPAKAQVERCLISALDDDCPDVFIKDKTKQIPVTSANALGDVVSFIRLSDRILNACGMQDSSVSAGNDIILRNAIYSVLASHHDEFRAFDKLTGRTDSINRLISLLGDFARYGINPLELGKAISAYSGEDCPYIEKLRDIKLLMEYLDELSDRYSLNLMSDPIARAAEVLKSCDAANMNTRRFRQLKKLLERRFAIIQFGVARNLTPGEYRLIEELDRLSRGVDVFLNSDVNDSKSAFGKCSSEVRSRLSSDGGCITVFDGGAEGSDDLRTIASEYSASVKATVNPTDDIRLFEIAGTDNRIGFIFDEILRLTREEGYRYRDIRIVCCDDEITGKMRSVAAAYGLDIFIDRRIELNNTVVPRFVMTLLSLPLSNFDLEGVLSAMRSGMLKVHPRYCDYFENYCVARNITNGVKLFNEAFYQTDPNDDHPMYVWVEEGTVSGVEEGLYKAGEFLYEHIVKRVLIPLRKAALAISHRTELSGKAEAVIDYLDEIRDYIIALRDELTDVNMSDSAEAVVRAYDETMALLASFMHEMNRVDISQRNFLELFRTDMMNKTVGTIPLKVDSVEIITPEHSYYTPCKIMFIIGAQRDNFPHKRTAEGIMSSSELTTLSSNISVTLPDKIVTQSREEFITSCLMFGSVTDRLYMIHEQGKGRSRFFDYLSECVDHIPVNNYSIPIYGTPTRRNYRFDSASIKPELMEQLLSDGLTVSVTTIEEYFTCPIEFMLEKVLKIRERNDNREIRSNGFGSFAHKMFELGVRDAVESNGNLTELGQFTDKLDNDPEFLDSFCEDILKRSVVDLNMPGTMDEAGNIDALFDHNQGNKLRRLFRFMYPKVLRECVDSGFIPSEYELEIGEDPYKLVYKTGNIEFTFKGEVDRTDLKETDTDEFRIIDYKTYAKGFKPELLCAGVQIQLPVYANAVKRGRAGSGITQFGYIPITLENKKETPLKFEVQNSVLSEEEMDTALEYADYMIRKALNDISEGKASALFNPAASHSSSHRLMGLAGNSCSKPRKQDIAKVGKKEAFDAMNSILEESRKNPEA